MKTVSLTLAVAAFVCVGPSGLAAETADGAAWQNRKKIISCAWEWGNATAEDILRFQPQIATSGVDGVCLYLYGKDANGKRIASTEIVDGSNRWTRAMFADQIPVYRQAFALPGLRHCFFDAFRFPHKKRIDWRDDATWERIANNLRVEAWFVRETGAAGIFCDVEEYLKTDKQFLRQANDPEWEELVPIVRRRGAELFRGVFEECPEIRIMFAWLLANSHELLSSSDPEASLRNAGLLWPVFVNGIVDVAPPTCRLIDNNETSYEYLAQREDYLRGGQRLRTNSVTLVDPKNRAKFRTIAQTAPALYLDMYVSKNEKSIWYKAPHLGSRLGQFQFDLAQALESTDEYVWLWCEKQVTIPWSPDYKKNLWVDRKPWESLLPGLTEVMCALRDPAAYMATFDSSGKANLADPAKFDFWQESHTWMPQGGFEQTEKGEARVAKTTVVRGCGSGCLIVGVDARPGEIYAVRLMARRHGGFASAVVRFQNEKGWHYYLPSAAVPLAAPDADGWEKGAAVVPVPRGATKLVLLLNVRQRKEDSCEFSDVEVFRIF